MNYLVLFVGFLVISFSNGIFSCFEVGTSGRMSFDGNSKMLTITFFCNNQKNYIHRENAYMPSFTLGLRNYPVNKTYLKVVDQNCANTDLKIIDQNFTIASEEFIYDSYLDDIIKKWKEQLSMHYVDRIISGFKVGTSGSIIFDGNSKMLTVTFFCNNQQKYIHKANASMPSFTLGSRKYPVNITDSTVVDKNITNIKFTIASEKFYHSYLDDIIKKWREHFIKLIGRKEI